MFIRFVLENFLSFREETEFNMLVGNFKAHKQHVYSGTIDTLRAAAIYGADVRRSGQAPYANFAIPTLSARMV